MLRQLFLEGLNNFFQLMDIDYSKPEISLLNAFI